MKIIKYCAYCGLEREYKHQYCGLCALAIRRTRARNDIRNKREIRLITKPQLYNWGTRIPQTP